MRIQYEIDGDEWNRMSKYVSNTKIRHEIAKDALIEWITRREGRDKKYRQERLIADSDILAPIVQHLIDNKMVTIK
jgi:hypothetical protein